jgi:hypothetical protein
MMRFDARIQDAMQPEHTSPDRPETRAALPLDSGPRAAENLISGVRKCTEVYRGVPRSSLTPLTVGQPTEIVANPFPARAPNAGAKSCKIVQNRAKSCRSPWVRVGHFQSVRFMQNGPILVRFWSDFTNRNPSSGLLRNAGPIAGAHFALAAREDSRPASSPPSAIAIICSETCCKSAVSPVSNHLAWRTVTAFLCPGA